MTINKETILRDLAIDAAIARFIQALYPTVTAADIQKRCEMDIYEGHYTVSLDGSPVCDIVIEGLRSFNMRVLINYNKDS